MTDDQLEILIGKLLRTGVVLAAAIVFAGAIWYLRTNGSAPVDYHHFDRGPTRLRSAAALPGPLKLIEAGLLLLIFTPVARVALALVAFYLERDRIYVGISAAVLTVLLFSIAASWL